MAFSLDNIDYNITKRHTHRSRKNSSRIHNKRKRSRRNYHSINDSCAVCLDDSSKLDTKLYPCKHMFHGQCLIDWVKSGTSQFNCPICRQEISHFVQLSCNDKINNQLVDIWNDRRLEKQKSIQKPKENPEKSSKNSDKLIIKYQIETKEEMEKPKISENLETKESKIEEKKEKFSVWKYLKSKSKITKNNTQNKNSNSILLINNQEFLATDYLTQENDPETNKKSNEKINFLKFSQTQNFKNFPKNSEIFPKKSEFFRKNFQKNFENSSENLKFEEPNVSKNSNTNSSFDFELNLLKIRNTKNFFCGNFAGLCAYFTAQAIFAGKSSLINPQLLKNCVKTGFYFYFYEEFKNIQSTKQNQNFVPFTSAFASGLLINMANFSKSYNFASQFQSSFPLALRFGIFFSLFEKSKSLNPSASSPEIFAQAALSASVTSLACFPVHVISQNGSFSQFQKILVSQTETGAKFSSTQSFKSGVSTATKQLAGDYAKYSARFVPACAVCSLAFDYAKKNF